jgi:tetratricopeptide (TPR) repeat protein
LMYYNHNWNFLSVARLMQGNFKDSYDASKKVAANVLPYAKEMSMVESLIGSPLLVLLSFQKWGEILTYPAPSKNLKIAYAFWLFARGFAYADIGKIDEAKKKMKKLKKIRGEVPSDAIVGLNSASLVLELALNILHANIALAEGGKAEGIKLLRTAVKNEDALSYDEPPDWYPSVRWMLGGTLYMHGDYQGALDVFLDDLKKYPHNGRALFGLFNTLKKLGKTDEAIKFEEEYIEAWKNADYKLTMEGL